MIIVSQNKDIIANFDNIESIDTVADLDGTGEVPYKIHYETSSKREELGKYQTEERAKEVLQEIIDKFMEYGQIQNLAGDIKQVCEMPKKYEMPKE